ncbi:MAG TPA: methyltransferase domain-containing protein [Polyangium sp.]|nr:methyltransferase domain-containing protein [Polyangium sp.]
MKTTNDTIPPRVNDAYQERNVLGMKKLYMNWGLWNDTTQELDDAALALILRLGELAELGPHTRLLDVGFGFGDQLIDWCTHAQLGSAEGLNICPEQTAITRERLAKAGLADRVHVQVGDAIALPFEDASFDAVTAVECAFHFHTRQRFFQQAKRVLKDGGRLVLADFIGIDRPSRRQRFAQSVAANAWRFAPNTFCSRDEYHVMLENTGFKEITIKRVTDRVIPPGMRYARRRLFANDLRRRMTTQVWVMTALGLGLSGLLGDPLPGEYVLVRAVK